MDTVPRRRAARAGLSIADVSRRTGIPASTLRFYEKEMPGLFWIRKTPGGHRRYSNEDVDRFLTIRRLTEEEAIPLAEVRRALASRGDHEPLREEVARLRELQQEASLAVAELMRKLEAVERRVEELAGSPGGKRRWFGKR